MTEPIHGTNRNVTTDNWFTSVPLADIMLSKQLTIVGTLRKNKKEIPPAFLPNRTKEVKSSEFAFDNEKTLVSFTPRKGKSVILLSTMHYTKSITEKGKPEIIDFYNHTKGGVDTFDQMVHTYTTARKTRRWPLRYFYGMLDQAGINALILFTSANNINVEKYKRRKFLFDLGMQLIKPHMEDRLLKPVQRDLKNFIKTIPGIEENEEKNPPPPKLMKQSLCSLCPQNPDRKTKHLSCVCHKLDCSNHKLEICVECNK